MAKPYPPASAADTGFSGIHLSVISSYRPPSPRDDFATEDEECSAVGRTLASFRAADAA